MSELYHTESKPQLICWDRKYYSNFEDQLKALKYSRTVYVGNLSFFTTENQIHETFNKVGPVKRVIMGLNLYTKTPCGFCFVEYYNQEHMRAALKYISGTVCDERVIRCDADGGFRPGRQYGRGRSGGQIRDERRADIDVSRGGMTLQQGGQKQRGHYQQGDRQQRQHHRQPDFKPQSVLGKSKRGDDRRGSWNEQGDGRKVEDRLEGGLQASRR